MAPAPTPGGVDLLSKQAPGAGARVGETLSAISADLQSGKTISQAFHKHEQLFGAFFCSIIAQGEASGNPGLALLKLSDYYEKRDTFHNKITRLLKFPLIILLGASGCFTTLLLFFIPSALHKVWTNPENLPIATKFITSLVTFVQRHVSETTLLSAICIILLGLLWQTNSKSPWFSSFAWNIPVIGDVLRKNSLQRFSLALATLVSCGFDHVHALTIAASELRNIPLEKRILHVLIDAFDDSKSIFNVLKEISIFPPLIIEMAKDEKKVNHTNEQLKKIAAFYQNEVEAAFNAFTIIIGPVFVSIIGLLGLGVLISLYLPVFKLVGNP